MKGPIVFRWCSSFLWSKKYREYIERIELPWTLDVLDNTGRWATFVHVVYWKRLRWSYCKLRPLDLLQVATTLLLQLWRVGYYKLRQVLYIEMMTAITNFDTITTDKITTEHCKEIFFNTNKFLTFTRSFFNPSRPFHHAMTFAVIRDRSLVLMSRIFTLLLYERAVLTDTWVRKASPSLLV